MSEATQAIPDAVDPAQADAMAQQQIGAMVNDSVGRQLGELTLRATSAEVTAAVLRDQLQQARRESASLAAELAARTTPPEPAPEPQPDAPQAELELGQSGADAAPAPVPSIADEAGS